MVRLSRPRALRTAVLATLLAAFVAACGTPVALRTEQARASDCDLALLGGELVTSAQSGLAVRGPDGTTEVIWPFGYTATREATGIVLRDDTGKIVAHEGQRVTLGGGGDANGLWRACAGTVQEVSNTGG